MMVLFTEAGSYRYVPVLAPRAIHLLVARLLDAADDDAPCLGRVDDVVDHRPAGGDVRADLRPDRLQQLSARRVWVVGSLDLLVEDDVDSTLGTHDRDLGQRPGDQYVRL